MKKISLVILATTLALLTACNTTEAPSEASSSTTSSQKQSTSSDGQASTTHSDSSEQTLTHNSDDKTTLLTQDWKFQQFSVTEIKAEWENSDRLELEINWQNSTTTNQTFNDVAEVTVHQGTKLLGLLERDDDFSDSVAAQANEDFELTYKLEDQKQDVKITITPKNGDAKTITVGLGQ